MRKTAVSTFLVIFIFLLGFQASGLRGFVLFGFGIFWFGTEYTGYFLHLIWFSGWSTWWGGAAHRWHNSGSFWSTVKWGRTVPRRSVLCWQHGCAGLPLLPRHLGLQFHQPFCMNMSNWICCNIIFAWPPLCMTMGAHFTFTLASGSIMFYICRLIDITLPG